MKKRIPKVSVLIPCYNSEEYIAESIQSALNQTWKNIEIVVVDDGSQDRTYGIVKKVQKINPNLILNRQEASGACFARNVAFKLSTGDYIQYLDADDLVSPDKIEKQVEVLKSKKGFLSYCKWGKFDNKIPDDSKINWSKPVMDKEEVTPVDWLLHDAHSALHSWLIPRTLIEQSKGWDISLSKNQDGEFINRLIVESNGIIYSKNGLAYYRANVTGSITNKLDTHKIKSSLIGCESYEYLLNKVEKSKRTRQAIANRYLKFCYLYGFADYESFQKAELKYNFYAPTSYLPFQSPMINFVAQLIGPINLIKIREWAKNF